MKIVALIRVSTTRQGRSGLGLEAQQENIRRYAEQRNAEVIATYIEVETGKRASRVELNKALQHARRAKAVLVVAKLDRLARNVHFISGLMQSGVPFDCADRPGADPFRLHIEAAIAEEEARKISQRTREALAAAKARGTKLGAANPNCRNLTDDARQRGADATREKTQAACAEILPRIQEWRAAGLSLGAIADRLNADGYTTTRGGAFGPMAVSRILART